MERRVLYSGLKFAISCVLDRNGASPAGEFCDTLSPLDQAKLLALFRIAGDHGQFHNTEKFGNLGDGLYEFKSFQIRMPFAYSSSERRLILVSHGFFKKKNKTPKEEIDRARELLEQDRPARLTLVKKTKS